MTALANFLGPFLFGCSCGETIGHEIVVAETIKPQVLLAAESAPSCGIY